MSEDKGFDFISLQVDYWDNPWQNRHAFLWELSKYHRVFFLSPPFYLVDLIPGQGRRKTELRGFKQIKKNLYSYVPPRYLPYNYRFSAMDALVRRLRYNIIRRRLRSLKFKNPILLIWHPNYVDMIGEFGQSIVVYYKYDHYAGYFGGSGIIDRKEKELLSKADMVCVTSKGLFDLHKNDCNEIHLLPNGVDYVFFSKSLDDEFQVPNDLAKIPKPRIGYVGVINEKVDFKLLKALCEIHPKYPFVLIGPVRVEQERYKKELLELKDMPNIFFLERKPSTQVPYYIKGLDVCMMCYLKNEWTYYGYPLKMHEYLACGKPCVSTDLPAVMDYENVITIAKTTEQWSCAIVNLLNENCRDKVNERLSVAKKNSWKVRVDEMLGVISPKLDNL